MEYEFSAIVERLISMADEANNERTLSVSFNSNMETGRTVIRVRKEKTLVFDPDADKRHLARIQRNGKAGF